MINKIKNIFNSPDKKRLLENFLSLSVLQGANYILPLITLPYLVRVLGPEKFGLLAFAQAFVSYFGILVDYGFGLSATREVSIHRENKEKLNEIFSSVIILKFIFFVLSLILMSFIVFFFNKFYQYWTIYYFTFLGLFSGLLFPSWLFQGLEKMKFITFINLSTRILFTISIFIFIKKASDFIYVPLISSLGGLIGGIISVYIVIKYLKIKFIVPKLSSLFYYLKDSTSLFFSQISISFFNQANTFIGGLIFNFTLIGYYNAAEKLFIAFRNIFSVIFQVLYPFFSKNKNSFNFLYIKIVFIISVFISLIIFLSSDFLVTLLFGNNFKLSSKILKIFSIVLFLSGINTLIFTLYFLMNHYYKAFFIITFISGILNIIFLIVLSYKIGIIGIPLSILIVEVLLIFLYIGYKKYWNLL